MGNNESIITHYEPTQLAVGPASDSRHATAKYTHFGKVVKTPK